MYFSYIYLLTDFYTNDFIPHSVEGCSVIIPVEKNLWENKKHYTQRLNVPSFSFCFGFFETSSVWKGFTISPSLDALSLYFFFPNYIKKAGTYVTALDLKTTTAKEQLAEIETQLQAQGIAPLAKNYTTRDNRAHEYNNYFYYSEELIAAVNTPYTLPDFLALFEKIAIEKGTNKQIIIPVSSEADFKQKQAGITAFEEWVSTNRKVYADLVVAYRNTNDAYLHQQIDNRKPRFRIDNYNDYLKLLREMAILHVNEFQRIQREQQNMTQLYGSQIPTHNVSIPAKSFASDEALQKEVDYLKTNRDSILNWYEKEYELLPLWYKRFGHIIKVMTGKRSFKSLYK